MNKGGSTKRLYNYSAEVTNIVDGDTFDALVDMGMKIYQKARIRVMGIQCPERGQPGFDEAKAFCELWLMGNRVYLSSQKRDAFGRWLCWVWREVDGTAFDLMDTFGERMIREGHAVRYMK
jgi:micrococcal nuclease